MPAPSTAQMRSALLAAPGETAIYAQPIPEPGPHEVRVRIEGCGVCGSDIPVWEGKDWFEYPREPGAPGHEGWGVIDAVGDDVHDLEPGTRVAALSYHAYSEYDLADAGSVIPLPEALAGQPFPGEALGCAVNVFRRSAIEPGQTVAVVGAGFLGSLLIQLAARAGAHVIAISRREAALEAAREMGAAEAIALDDAVAARLPESCERVIEAAGKQETLDLAGELTKTRGRLVIAGFHQDGRRSVDMQTWNWRGLDVINAHERAPRVYVEGVEIAARMVAADELDPSRLYTHRFGLDQLAEAFETTVARPDGFMKALVLA